MFKALLKYSWSPLQALTYSLNVAGRIHKNIAFTMRCQRCGAEYKLVAEIRSLGLSVKLLEVGRLGLGF